MKLLKATLLKLNFNAYIDFCKYAIASVGWVERSDTHRVFRHTCWVSLRLS